MRSLDQLDADVALGTLTSLAHDYNNALAIIISNVSFAIEDLPPTHPVVAELREIEAAARRATALTKQLARRAAKIVTFAPPMRARSITQIHGSGIHLIAGSGPLRIAR